MKSVILTLQEQIKKKEVTKEEVLYQSLKDTHENHEKCNSFVTILDDACLNEKEGMLEGIPYALKDNFSTKVILTTGSSNTLKNYVPVYDATVYEKLKNAGATLVGKTVMDEFGLGATGTTGHTGVVKNPFDITRQAGGSSAGSACVVASGAVPFAIGSDTGDSVRKPAAYCGIVGYKPTYGMISRYGLFPFASSLDHVGVLSRNVMDAAIVTDAIKGLDERDMTTFDSSEIHLTKALQNMNLEGKKLFYIKEIADINFYENPSDELKKTLSLFQETLENAKKSGFEVFEESMDEALLSAIPSTYTCISCAEATSNLSNLTGIIFGPRGESKDVTEMMKEHRTNGFSPLIKRRLIIGSYVLQKENQEKYFLNASRVRHLIVEKMNAFFEKYDALILPCSSGGAKPLEGEQNVISKSSAVLENHMVIGNFGGFPSITIPNGLVNGLPVGINLTSKIKNDAELLTIAAKLEEILDIHYEIGGSVL